MKIFKLDKILLDNVKFDCGDEDLNDFLFEDSFTYENFLLSKTYLVFDNNQLVAYYSVLNDRIDYDNSLSKRKWNKKVKEDLPPYKNYMDSLPAVKVGRLAVDKKAKGKGYGTKLVTLIKGSFSSRINKSGCKYITVDSYKESQEFYKKQDFRTYPKKIKGDKDTILMYYNLSSFS